MYKVYRIDNYLVINDTQKKEWFYGLSKDVFIDKSNKNKTEYVFFNIKDFTPQPIDLSKLLKEDGTAYTESEWDNFYRKSTGAINEPLDFNSEVSLGRVKDKNYVHKWGVNEDVGTTFEILTSFGGAFNPNTDIMKTAQTFTITYNNTTDGSGQTGALVLLITYLDENFSEKEAIHVLGGTGSDVTTFIGVGINRVVVIANGGLGWNENDITITATTDTTTQAQVPAEKSVTQQGIFHTQIGHTLLLDWLLLNALRDAGGGQNPKVEFRIYSWSRVTLTRYDIFEYSLDTGSVEGQTFDLNKFPIGGREVIYIEVQSGSTGTKTSARFRGIQHKIT